MNPKNYLQDYLNNKLSSEQKTMLENDPAFQMLLDEWQFAENAINPNSKINQFRQLTKQLIKENKRRYYFKLSAIAAGFLLAVGFSFWYTYTPANLFFDQHYQALYSTRVTRNGIQDKTMPVFFQSIDSLYANKEYSKACALMQSWVHKKNFQPSSTYYFRLAELFLLTERPLKTLESLEKVNFGYTENLLWLKAWAYYNSGQPVKARSLFVEISRGGGSFQEEARVVLSGF